MFLPQNQKKLIYLFPDTEQKKKQNCNFYKYVRFGETLWKIDILVNYHIIKTHI